MQRLKTLELKSSFNYSLVVEEDLSEVQFANVRIMTRAASEDMPMRSEILQDSVVHRTNKVRALGSNFPLK